MKQHIKHVARIAGAFDEFVRSQSFSGILLLVCALIALVWANSHYSHYYEHINHAKAGVSFGNFHLYKSMQHWVNDGLMAVFFLLVGLEIKRELVSGELREFNRALLPICAAIGGMVVPAVIYVAFNWHHPEALHGWGIPMATDIAFALGVLALLGDRVPRSLVILLSAAAIIDDLGAVIVIAVFYTQDIQTVYLIYALIVLLVLVVLNLLKVRKLSVFLILGAALWYCMMMSGVHATVAGVILAFVIPMDSLYQPKTVSDKLHQLTNKFDEVKQADKLKLEHRQSILHSIENLVFMVETPLQKLEHALHTPVTYIIIPIFVLFNAGIPFVSMGMGSTLSSSVTIGVILGLVVGKVVGIFAVLAILIKSGVAKLPKGANFKQLLALSLIAGIGFTMSIFISELAFPGLESVVNEAKTGILIASVIAGVLGFVLMYLATRKK